VLEIGKGRMMREGARVAILSFGTRLAEVLKAAEAWPPGVSVTVADARFAKPLDDQASGADVRLGGPDRRPYPRHRPQPWRGRCGQPGLSALT
jgi:hypothetical protein